jgi:Na+/glutamate symporter
MPLQLNRKTNIFSNKNQILILLAMGDSETVSIGLDTNGVLIVIFFVSLEASETLSDEK